MDIKKPVKSLYIEDESKLIIAGQCAYMESNKWYDVSNMLDSSYDSQKYICLLLSCELYLKSILMFNNTNVTKGNYKHDLYKMYRDIPPENQEEIKESVIVDKYIGVPIIEKIKQFESFEDELKFIANDFINTRYEYEKYVNGYQIYLLLDFVMGLAKILLKICKKYMQNSTENV